jgi:diguanylate cyclase (GGDEF)-like protein
MEHIFPENWTVVHYGLILSLSCAQLLVLYVLGGDRNPPAGLGMFTVYFMVSLLCWLAYSLQQRNGIAVALDLPSVAAIISAYTLFLAAGQRAGIRAGRLPAGAVCVVGSLSAFFVAPAGMFLIQTASTALFFTGAGVVSGWRAWRARNVGDLLLVLAAVLMVFGAVAANLRILITGELGSAQAIALGAHAMAYTMVVLGFLASALVDAQNQLSQLETEDPLTRLANRRGLEEILRVTIANAERRGHATSVVMVDVDHFRQVNDSFGHETGDRLLQQIAHILRRSSRASDVVARVGGEEFLLVLPETNGEQARVLAERVRHRVAERPLDVAGQSIATTVSLGIASSVGKVDIDALGKAAQRAIYLAKRSGRNRVASAEPSSITLTGSGGES